MSANSCTWKAPLVTLSNGRQVLSNSQEWMAECEARHILDMPSKPARLAMLDGIEKRRGPEARRELEQRIMDLWHKSRAVGATA